MVFVTRPRQFVGEKKSLGLWELLEAESEFLSMSH